MLSAANGRTTMYLPPAGASLGLGVAASAANAGAAAVNHNKKASSRAVSHAHLRASDQVRPAPAPAKSSQKLAASASPAIVPAKAVPHIAPHTKAKSAMIRDERRKTLSGVTPLKSSVSSPAVEHGKRSSFTTESTAADIAMSKATVVIGQSLKPKCVECRLRDATTKVEFDGHQRYVCAKCAERFTALQKALSFDDNDDDRVATPPPTKKNSVVPPPDADEYAPPPPPVPATLAKPTTESDYGEPPPEAKVSMLRRGGSAAATAAAAPRNAKPIENDYGEAPPELRNANVRPKEGLYGVAPGPAAARPLQLSMPVVERVAIPERRVDLTTAAYVSDSEESEDNGYIPLAAGARVLGTMSLSDSSDDEKDPEQSAAVAKLRLETMDSIIGMEPLSDEE